MLVFVLMDRVNVRLFAVGRRVGLMIYVMGHVCRDGVIRECAPLQPMHQKASAFARRSVLFAAARMAVKMIHLVRPGHVIRDIIVQPASVWGMRIGLNGLIADFVIMSVE